MPRYQIQHPDGRTVTVEGERAPTEQDAQQIFASLPPKQEQPVATAPKTEEPKKPSSIYSAMNSIGNAEMLSSMNPGDPGPQMVKGLVLSGGGTLLGAAIGSMFPGPGTLIGAGIGALAGNTADQLTRPDQKGIKKGELLANTGLALLPGGTVAKTGVKGILAAGAKEAAKGITAKTAETLIDEGRLPTGAEAAFSTALPAAVGGTMQKIAMGERGTQRALVDAMKTDSVKRGTLDAAAELGMVVSPSEVNPTTLGNAVEGMSGKAATRQAASNINQRVVDREARGYIGVPENTPLNVKTLNEVRAEAGKAYDEIAKLSDDAGTIEALAAVDPKSAQAVASARQNLEMLKQARADSNAYYRYYDSPNGADPANLAKARDLEKTADALEAEIEKAAAVTGNAQLYDNLKAARQRIAKTYTLERALNLGDGTISARDLGKALDKSVPLSGNIEKIAKFSLAFPQAVKESTQAGGAGVSKLEAMGGLLTGAAMGSATHNLPATLASMAAPAVLGTGARKLVLSRPYQSMVARVPLGDVALPQDNLANTIRVLTQQAALQNREKRN